MIASSWIDPVKDPVCLAGAPTHPHDDVRKVGTFEHGEVAAGSVPLLEKRKGSLFAHGYVNCAGCFKYSSRTWPKEILSRVVYDAFAQAASLLTPSSNTTPVMTSARSFAPFSTFHRF